MARMDYAEIKVDQKFHKHIIGKSGANSKYYLCSYWILWMVNYFLKTCFSFTMASVHSPISKFFYKFVRW